MVKNLPAMQETRVRSLGWEDPWRREWLITPVFLPGESHGQRSLAGYSPWGLRIGHNSAIKHKYNIKHTIFVMKLILNLKKQFLLGLPYCP